MPEGAAVTLGDFAIRPIRLAEEYAYAFLVEGDGKRVLIVPDELHGWEPPEGLPKADLAVLPMGIAELNPLSGERQFARHHPLLKTEATFEQTLDVVRKLQVKRVIMTHIEEPDQLTHDDLQALGRRLVEQGLPVQFAYDTLLADI